MKTEVIPVNCLSTSDRTQMYTLLSEHFHGIDPKVFEQDLADKSVVILLKNDEDILKGFSTMLSYQTTYEGELIGVIYSGDTIVDPSAWSSPALSKTWLSFIKSLKENYPSKLYWLLISSGFRTYRFLPTFAKEFYPRYDVATPTTQKLMNSLAQERFGTNYNSETGIVRFPIPQKLKPYLLEIPPNKLTDPHVQYFLTRNPHHHQGDELVCLTELNRDNLTLAGLRFWDNSTTLLPKELCLI